MPASTLKVRHRCDNPPCQNPAHLELGTQADNVADMMTRRRNRQPGRPGRAHHAVRLSEQQVLEIRRLRKERGLHYHVIAERFGISRTHSRRICLGERWKHLSVKGM
jgi:hypothetical protein